MTANDNEWTPGDNEFDEWTQEREDEAIEQAGEALQNKYVIHGLNMWVKFPSGNTYHLPLNVDATLFQQVNDIDDPVGQIHAIIQAINPEQAESINREPFINLTALSLRYADVFQKVQNASLGKLKSYSGSSTNTTKPSGPTSPDTAGA